MKTPFFVLPVVFLTFTVPSPSPAVEKPGDGAANRFILTKVRLLPKPGKARLLVGARIVGSNEGPTTAPEEMARIDRASADNGWWEVNIPPGKVFRYVKMDSASGAGLALAEIEFYSTTGRLRGNGFGTSVGKEQAAFSFDKALDGDPNTYFESPAEHSYVGIDLGSQSQAPAPHFSPAGGAYGQPQKIELSTWPPGTTIRYTTDGSVPSASNGQVYSKPLTVLATASVAAIASREGLADSDISIATYRVGAGAAAETQIKSYHIGNSLTDTVNGFLDPIALSAGRNFLFLRKTIPGAGIQLNFESCGKGFASPDAWAADYQAVFEKKVDHLFLQPFPNPPGLESDGEFGNKFIELARKANPLVQVCLYAQWPAWDSWKNDAHCTGAGWMKPPWFPPNRQPANWEEAMANKMLYFLELKKTWDRQAEARGEKPIRLCPGGPALVRLKHEIEAGKIPGLTNFHDTVFADDIHLTRQGRYLVALVHYACIFRADPQGKVTYANSGLTAQQAAGFQRIAWETVIAEPLSGVRP